MRGLRKSLAAMCLLGASAATPAVAEEPSEAACTTRVLFVANTSPAPGGDASLLAGTRAFAGASCVTVVSDDAVTVETADTFDAVVVSSSVVPAVLGDRLADTSAAVLVSEPYLFDEFNLASAGRELTGHSGRLDVTTGRLAGYAPASVTALASAGTVNYAPASTNLDPIVGAKPAGTTHLALFGTTIEEHPYRAGFFAGYGAVLSPAGTALLRSSLTWLTSGQPRNDDFADAISTGVGYYYSGPLSGATLQAGETTPNGAGSTWWRLKAPRSGILAVRLHYDTVLRVGTGASAAQFVPVGEYNSGWAFVPVVAGTVYRIQASGSTSGFASFQLADVFPPPPNDLFGKATRLEGRQGSVDGYTIGASVQPGEPPLAGGTPDSVWYRWTAPSDQLVSFGVDPSMSVEWGDFRPAVTVLQGSTMDALIRVAGPDIAATFEARAGRTYRIAVDGAGAGRGRFVLKWGPAISRPANDDFDHPADLTGSAGSVELDAKGATLQLGEPVPPYGDGSAWYRWTAPTDGLLVAPAAIAWAGEQVGALARVPTTLDGAVVRAGTTYRLQVPTTSWAESNVITIVWSMLAPVPNDNLANAVAISGASGTVSGDNRGATVEPGEGPGTTFCETENNFWEPAHARTVWYRWTAPIAGHVSFTVVSRGQSNGPTDCLELLRGDRVDALSPVGSHSNADVDAGDIVLVRVSSTCWGQWYCEGSGGNPFDVSWRYLPTPPANDDFFRPVVLTEPRGQAEGYAFGATSQPNEPDPGCGPESVWWAWTAPSDGFFDVLSPTCWGLYTGDSIDALHQMDRAGPGPRFAVQQGVTYRLRVAGADDVFGFEWTHYPPPPNDAFADAIPLSGDSGSISGHAVGATIEAGEPEGHAEVSVWWRWQAPRDGVLRIPANLYAGTSLTNLVPITDGSVRAGETYFIAVTHDYGWFNFTWTMHRPANDDFAQAIPITAASGETVVDNEGATTEPGEPEGIRTLWWTRTPDHDGVLRFDTTGTTFPTRISVFTGDALGELDTVATSETPMAVVLRAGRTYRISVGEFGYGPGSVHLRWAPAVSNDLPATAITLAGPNGSTNAVTTEATNGGSESGPWAQHGAGHTVWYRWTAPIDGTVTFDTVGSEFDTVLAAYLGDPTGGGTLLSSNDDWYPARTSRVNFLATAGTEYWVMLGGYANGHGAGTLRWTLSG